PGRPVLAGFHAAIASGVTHTVRLPRSRSATSYSRQFSTRYRAFGILWRRGSLCLYGIEIIVPGAGGRSIILLQRPTNAARCRFVHQRQATSVIYSLLHPTAAASTYGRSPATPNSWIFVLPGHDCTARRFAVPRAISGHPRTRARGRCLRETGASS